MMIAPPTIDQAVLDFAGSIVREPHLVRIRLVVGQRSTSCSANVRAVVSKLGGRMIKGWRIWLLPYVLLQAEAHSVWEMPNGELVDVTSTGDGDTESVFFRDEAMQQTPGDDFIHSPRANLCGDPMVDDYIRTIAVANEWTDRQAISSLVLPPIAEQARVKSLNSGMLALSSKLVARQLSAH